MKLISVSLVVAPTMLLLLGCAQGSTIGEGGSGGEGGTSGQSSTNPNTTHQTGAGSENTSNVTSGNNVANASTGNFGATVGNATSGNAVTTSNVATSGPVTVANAVSSSSSGTVMACNPESPSQVCGAGEHCLPDTTQPGTPACQGPIGSGIQYSECSDTAAASDCGGPLFCFDLGDALPCCLAWCTSDNDCNGSNTCFLLNAYVGNTQYGFCYDGGGGC